jgi:hypothetical protein
MHENNQDTPYNRTLTFRADLGGGGDKGDGIALALAELGPLLLLELGGGDEEMEHPFSSSTGHDDPSVTIQAFTPRSKLHLNFDPTVQNITVHNPSFHPSIHAQNTTFQLKCT